MSGWAVRVVLNWAVADFLTCEILNSSRKREKQFELFYRAA